MVFLATGRTNESWQTAILPVVSSSYHRRELISPVLWDHMLVQNLPDPHSFFILLQLCDLLQYIVPATDGRVHIFVSITDIVN